MTIRTGLLSLLLAAGFPAFAEAQQPTLAEDNIAFTQSIISRFHFVAWVALEVQKDKYTNFQYDRYPRTGTQLLVERLKTDEGVFARRDGRSWLRSDDWGETGKPIDDKLAAEMDGYADIIQAPFKPATHKDASQGGTVWKFIDRKNSDDNTLTFYTYEKTREHPHPNGVYPRFTFMKAAHDSDGKLFLRMMTAQLKDDSGRDIPITIRMTYLVPVSAGSKVTVYDKDTHKKKLDEVVGKNSGWEITTQQSAPPPGQ